MQVVLALTATKSTEFCRTACYKSPLWRSQLNEKNELFCHRHNQEYIPTNIWRDANAINVSTLNEEGLKLFCSSCGNDVGQNDRFCRRCGNALSSATEPPLTEEHPEMDPLGWQDTLDYRLVLHAPEVRRLIEDASGTSKGGMTAEEFLKSVLPKVNVSGAKLPPVELMMEINHKVRRRLNLYTESQNSRLYDAPSGRVIAAAATALAGRELPIISGNQGAESCTLLTETSSSAWSWKGEMQLEFSRAGDGTRVEARTKIPGKPMFMRGGATFVEEFFDELSDRLSLQP